MTGTTSPAGGTVALNLLDTPWVTVRWHDGSVKEVGLLAVFQQAQQIEQLVEISPVNLVALHRLLLAITHRALTRSREHWSDSDRASWHAGSFPGDAVVEYLEHWRDRFWLFHPEHPFMQVAALATADETKEKFKPWTQVALERANGNTPVLFDHGLDSTPIEVGATTVLRHLLGFLQFTPGGLVKVFRSADNAGPLSNSAAVLALGRTLAQTILLNLHPSVREADVDLPSWEQPAPSIADLQRPPRAATGFCDRYTRLTRAVLLQPDAQPGAMRWLRFGAGLALAEDENAPDPMVCRRMGSSAMVRLSFYDGRAIWRDLGALLPEREGVRVQPAAVMNWAANLHDAAMGWNRDVDVLVAGLCSDKAKLVRWRCEAYSLPHRVLREESSARIVREELERSEALFVQLRQLQVDLLRQTMPDPASRDTWSRARQCVDNGPAPAIFFSSAERGLPLLLRAVADDGDSYEVWSAVLLAAARASWNAAVATVGASATAARAAARVQHRLQRLLGSLRAADSSSTPDPVEAIA